MHPKDDKTERKRGSMKRNLSGLGTRMAALCLLMICLCLAVTGALADGMGGSAEPFVQPPVIVQDAASPSGLRTTWKCVYFGSYPSVEVVDSEWDAVDEYALQQGDLIRDDGLYARLASADWQDSVLEMDGASYLRVGPDAAPAAQASREQHYNWTYERPWHYFRIMPLRWRVLDVQGDRALLLADRMPDSVPFHAVDEDVAWDESTLRSWLNGYGADANRQGEDFTGKGFVDRAFTDREREAIVAGRCENLANRDYGTDSGADTEDVVFILSNAEVFEGEAAGRYGFFPGRDYDDPAKRFSSTLYAKCMGAWWSPVEAYAGNSFWFMRTAGYNPRSVTYVCDFGYIYSKGTLVTCGDAAVLPALWVDLRRAELADAGERSSSEIMHSAGRAGQADAGDIDNPVVIEDSAMPGGAYTVWNAVTFGSYPQTEIVADAPSREGAGEEDVAVDPKLYARLAEAGGESVELDGTRYIRLDGRWFRCDPIVWRVLEVQDDTALLRADRALDSVPYHASYTDVFWEASDVRKWLNGMKNERVTEAERALYGDMSFAQMAFTQEEYSAVVPSSLSNDNNFYFGTSCGSSTHDRVFILSEAEVFSSDRAKRYGFRPSDAVADIGRRMRPTAYALARGAWQSEQADTAKIGFWLLRTNGYTRDNVVYVGEKGYLYNRGIPVTCMDACIVPAIRIRLGEADYARVADISSREER